MKRFLASGLAVLALAALVPVGAATAGDGYKGHHGKKEHHAHGMRHGHGAGHREQRNRTKAMIRLIEALERYDLDEDGSITQEEVDQFRADRLKAFDKDGNGTLSLEEYEALWLDAMKRRMVRMFQKHDRDGDGEVTTEEFSERTKHMVLRRDRNEDGVLNKDDLPRKDTTAPRTPPRQAWQRRSSRQEPSR